MRYVMSDVHGEYELFMALLREIGFSDDDELFIIGDVIDKGEGSVRLLKYVLSKDNIHLSMGNHEYEFLKFYYSLIQKDDVDFDAVLERLQGYFPNDGDLLDFETMDMLEEIPNYFDEPDFIGVHAGILLDEDGRAIHPKELPIEEIIYNRSFKSPNVLPANSRCVFFGHTSSMAVFPDASIIVYKRDGSEGADIRDYIKVHLDTGAFVSGILGCFSIDECKCYFVKRGETGLAGERLALLKNV